MKDDAFLLQFDAAAFKSKRAKRISTDSYFIGIVRLSIVQSHDLVRFRLLIVTCELIRFFANVVEYL